MKHIRISCIAFFAILFASCGKEEHAPFDQPFVHIMSNNASSETVSYLANATRTYNIYLSSKPLTSDLEVRFEITSGNGLTEGLDYEVLTPGNSILFLPGIYDMPIRIRWIANPDLDPTKDNTLTIDLVSTNQNIILGLPGPDQLQKRFTITKVK